MGHIYVVGTSGTKSEALDYVRDELARNGFAVKFCDVETRVESSPSTTDVPSHSVAAYHPEGPSAVFGAKSRGAAVTAMAVSVEAYFADLDDVKGIIGIGGSSGTLLASAAMQPIATGIPKVLLSTIGSSDLSHYIRGKDITVIPSIVDIENMNYMLRASLDRAISTLSALLKHQLLSETPPRSCAISMLGVTTNMTKQLIRRLEPDLECIIFHANGSSTKAMEQFTEQGQFEVVFDLATSDIADYLCGGTMPCVKERLDIYARFGTPYIGSIGGVSSIKFGPRSSLPEIYSDHIVLEVTPTLTIVRPKEKECRQIGEWIGRKLSSFVGPFRFLLPEGGVSSDDTPGSPSHDEVAFATLVNAIEMNTVLKPHQSLVRIPHAIDTSEFAEAVHEAYQQLRGL